VEEGVMPGAIRERVPTCPLMRATVEPTSLAAMFRSIVVKEIIAAIVNGLTPVTAATAVTTVAIRMTGAAVGVTTKAPQTAGVKTRCVVNPEFT